MLWAGEDIEELWLTRGYHNTVIQNTRLGMLLLSYQSLKYVIKLRNYMNMIHNNENEWLSGPVASTPRPYCLRPLYHDVIVVLSCTHWTIIINMLTKYCIYYTNTSYVVLSWSSSYIGHGSDYNIEMCSSSSANIHTWLPPMIHDNHMVWVSAVPGNWYMYLLLWCSELLASTSLTTCTLALSSNALTKQWNILLWNNDTLCVLTLAWVYAVNRSHTWLYQHHTSYVVDGHTIYTCSTLFCVSL